MIISKAPYLPISSESATSKQSLGRLLLEHRAEVEGVLGANSLGNLVAPLYEAIETSEIQLRRLTRGETLEWLAQLDPASGQLRTEPACALPAQPIEVWEIPVVIRTQVTEPSCELSARRMDSATGSILIDATKLAPESEVWLEAATGEKVATASGGATTAIPDPHPYLAEYRVQARAIAKVSEIRYRLLVFANGLNVALSSSEKTALDEARNCPEVSVKPLDAQAPYCSLKAAPREILAGDSVEVDGIWEPSSLNPSPKIEVSEGRALSSPFPQQRVFPVPGRFILRSRARNERAEVSECYEEILVRPRWRARLSGLGAVGRDLGYSERAGQEAAPAELARTSSSGWQGRLSVERLADRTVGLVAGFSGGSLEIPSGGADAGDLGAPEWNDHHSASLRQADFGANFHFPGTRRLDVIWGLFVGAMHLAEFRSSDTQNDSRPGLDEHGGGSTYFAWGMNMIAELNFPKSCWAAFGEIRVRDIPARSPHGEVLEFGLGAALHF